MKTEFLKPRFTGPRFDEHTLPVDVAGDLAAYEGLVIELAKHLWMLEHPGRKRVPRGFEKSFSLHLEGMVEGGSARPALVCVAASALAINISCGSYFEQARDLVADCIKTNAAQQPLPDKFPKELLDYFNVFGRSLAEGEAVELPTANAAPAVLTPDRRKQLVLAAQKFYTKAVELTGTIGETDWEKQTFRLRPKDGPAIAAVPLPDAFKELARKAGGMERTLAVVKGVGIYDAWDDLQKVSETHHLEIQPNAALADQLEELSALGDGWFEGKGKALDKDQLAWVTDKLVDSFPAEIAFPHVAPTPDGGLFFEWIQKTWRVSAEFLLPAHRCELQATDTATGKSVEAELDLDQAENWPALYKFVGDHV
jgi:hypothetical protein